MNFIVYEAYRNENITSSFLVIRTVGYHINFTIYNHENITVLSQIKITDKYIKKNLEYNEYSISDLLFNEKLRKILKIFLKIDVEKMKYNCGGTLSEKDFKKISELENMEKIIEDIENLKKEIKEIIQEGVDNGI